MRWILLMLSLLAMLTAAGCGGKHEGGGPEVDKVVTEEPVAEEPIAEKPAPPTEAPSDADDFAITVDQAEAAGLPAIGFKLSGLKGHGWTRFAADRNRYISLSGPPGGPLSFSVTPYSDTVSGPQTLKQLFTKAVEGHGGLDPVVEGEPEQVSVGGSEREAQAFRTGRSLATSNWCVVRIPAEGIEGAGLLMTLRLGTKEDRDPTCGHSLKSRALKPLAESFELE
ncbi:MAG: hypothetical protein JRF63_13630 [Deltaproteobacteria bacterium]|nr:hypothetical protein [Deltaproteobacteria bacterium]